MSSSVTNEFNELFGFCSLYESLAKRIDLLDGLCVSEPIYNNTRSNNIDHILENLRLLSKCLQENINNMVFEWLQNNNVDLNLLIEKSIKV